MRKDERVTQSLVYVAGDQLRVDARSEEVRPHELAVGGDILGVAARSAKRTRQ